MEQIIGYLAAALTTISFLPQAVKVIREKDTSAISLSMYVIFTCGVFAWLIYGIAIDNMPIIAANVITLLLSGVILYMKATEAKRNA